MRIALGGIAHETNTFSPIPTDLARFEEAGILRGDQIVERHLGAHTSVAGLLTIAEEASIEIVPLLYAWANPAGRIRTQAFEALLDELLGRLRSLGPWDAVLLAQHGAAVSETCDDADFEVVSRVRAEVGPNVPIGVALDMHANVSAGLVRAATAIVGYRTNPHIDARERGAELASLIASAARGAIEPTIALETVPTAIEIVRQSTLESPMREIVAEAESILAEPSILSVSVFEGYPYADVPQMGMSCLVVSDGSADASRRAARRIASTIWAARAGFTGDAPGPTEAIAAASESAAWPSVLLDVGDNIGAGGPGDSTVLLEAALDARLTGFLIILHDPAAVQRCLAVGESGELNLTVGAVAAGTSGRPVRVHGTVRTISDGRYEETTPTHGGFRHFDAGPTVVLDIGDDDIVVLTSRLTLPTSLQQLISLGIEPSKRRFIVAKGVVSPQTAYGPIARRMTYVDTPGVTSRDLSRLDYRRRRRPLHPFEDDATYSVASAGRAGEAS
jgi:microcystin degradation protein MlrC